jgi:lipopolysaccharide cholinephosphotransferase
VPGGSDRGIAQGATRLRPATDSELEKVQLELLSTFRDYCATEGLTYSLAAGTLLGAVRHHGFIPWDNDVDVLMAREEYELLRRSLRARPYRREFMLIDPQVEPDYPLPFLKFSDLRTRLDDDGAGDAHLGINIDIFPADGWPDGGVRRRLHGAVLVTLRVLLECALSRPKVHSREAARLFLRGIGRALGRGRLAGWIDRVSSRYSSESCLESGILVWGPQRRIRTSALLGESTELSFEKQTHSGPPDPAAVLNAMYGPDFMIPPPLERRFTHTYAAFVAQEPSGP